MYVFFFQAEDGIRDLVRSRGLGDVYKRQVRDLGGQQLVAGLGQHAGHVEGDVADADHGDLLLSLIHI